MTINDLIEAIVGEMPNAEKKRARPFVAREDGSVLVDALVGIEEVEEYFPPFKVTQDDRRFSTLGGFVCHRLGHIPQEGEHFEHACLRFEVMDMDRHRVDKVLVSRSAGLTCAPSII